MKTTTRRRILFLASLLPLVSRSGQSQNATTKSETASVLEKHMEWMEQDFLPAAEAMPQDKFFWAPKNGEFQGVRSFAEQIVHVAEVNFALSAAILGEPPSAEADTSAETAKTRPAVLNYLRASFAYTHKAISSITEDNAKAPIKHPIFDMITTRMGLGIVAIAHPFNHYGQIVEYLRMNNIVPPASRH
jgi:uncharacterized damage-inducible protein DinB